MKIENTVDPLKTAMAPLKDNAPQQPRRASAAEAATPQPENPLKLSGLSSRLKQIESSPGGAEAFDTARVNEIRQALRNGGFKVDADAVADKLLSNARDLYTQRH